MSSTAVAVRRPRRRWDVRRTLRQMRREWSAYLFLSPGLILFSVFTVFALLFAFYLTFTQWNIIEPDRPFVGLANYSRMVHDEDFRQSVINTAYYTGATVPLTHGHRPADRPAAQPAAPLPWHLFRTMYFLPVVTPFVVVAIVWKWLYNSDFGLFNFYLLKTHLINEPLMWLADKNLAMPAVVLMSVWSGVGFSMVIYLAGLQAIPQELYEAARVDGAGLVVAAAPHHDPDAGADDAVPDGHGDHRLVPGVHPDLHHDQRRAGRTGPPRWSSTSTRAAFKFYEMGYASTLAYGLFALLFVFTLIQLRMYRQADA